MIKHIQIENYKSIRQLSLDLRQINILIGSNGVGKSNFVSFLELLNNIYKQRLGNYVMSHDGANTFLHKGAKNSKYISGLFNFNNKNAFFFKLRPTAGNSLYIEESGDYLNNKADLTYSYESWDRTIWDKTVKESEICDQKQWRAGYVKNFLESFTVYHFHDTSTSSPLRQPCQINDNMMLRHDGSNLPAFLYKLQNKHPEHFTFIEAVIRSIAPYFKRFTLHQNEINSNMISLTWEENDSDMYMDATNFSDGTLRFIALATLLLQPSKPQTIVIDEPELGLHPTAIQKLSGLIRKAAANGAQIIIATQSVNLVNCFQPEDILVSDREAGQSVFRHLDAQSLEAWLEDYNLGTIWEKNIIGGQP